MVTVRTIAIVDDDEGVRDALSGLMRSLGYGVRCYASATDFLEDAANPAPDCVISDVRMPGISGEGLLAALRTNGRHTPVVLMTAFPTPVLRERLIAKGALGLLDKPVDGNVLADILARAVPQDA
jgi:FixJ family two-component response regulator